MEILHDLLTDYYESFRLSLLSILPFYTVNLYYKGEQNHCINNQIHVSTLRSL